METIHIIAPFINANGGDWRAIDMYLKLRDNIRVTLWCSSSPHPSLASYPIRTIKPYQGEAPNKGTLYISGPATAIGSWYDAARFERVVLIHNLFDQTMFYNSMHRLTKAGRHKVEITYASDMIKRSIGLPGEVLHPIPYPQRFKPVKKRNNDQFTVGRISSDQIGKHHFRDIELYRNLAAYDVRVRIVGGTCLEPWLSGYPHVELLPCILQSEVPEMLATFDCFFYRVSSHLKEAFGIVVAEAMASGIPVVCHDEGGYTEIVRDYKNGFLFTTNQEALDLILGLKPTRP